MNIIITGASKGIGRELVRFFSKRKGNKILAVSRNAKKLEGLMEDCRKEPSAVQILPFDISSDDISPLLELIDREMKTVDLLINNAGKLVNKPVKRLTDEDLDAMFSINIRAPFRLIRDLIPRFSSGSHIVNIGSMGGYQGSVKFPGLSLYSSSKGALAILTECLAEELKEEGIRVNCLALGSAQTEMLEEAFPGYVAPVSAAEMAEYIGRFALEGHKHFNGKVLPVSSTTP